MVTINRFLHETLERHTLLLYDGAQVCVTKPEKNGRKSS